MSVIPTEITRTETTVFQPIGGKNCATDELFQLLKERLSLKDGVLSLKIEMSARMPTIVEVKYYFNHGNERKGPGIPPLNQQ